LFLDSRVTESMLADAETLAKRHAELLSGGPLRLAFSGRLNRMKGADDLIRVAKNLDSLGVDFTLDIFGEGTLSEFMAAEIKRERVTHRVRLRGVVDFTTELMPFIQNNIDLLVCCHRQGDPSCTYLETFACGVPIVGYANEALSGLLRNRPFGWTTPLNRPARLAQRIAALNQRREQLRTAGEAALEFASRHTFETEFAARIDQIQALVKND
jgi:glycosyltransferase involved in cell wall biosynthesis